MSRIFVNWWVLKRRLHSSWLAAVLSVGFLLGAAAAGYVAQNFVSVPLVVFALVLLAAAFWQKTLLLVPLVFVSGMVLGMWRGSLDVFALGAYKNIYNHEVTIQGVVAEDPERDKTGNTLLRLEVRSANGHALGGKVWVSTGTKYVIKRGDVVTLNGNAMEGFGTFSAVFYRAEVTIVERPEPGDVAGRIRDWFADMIRKAVPEPEASLGIGYLVGQRNSLPPELDDALRTAGLTHVVVASGYNLTILVRLARRLFIKVSKYFSALAAGSMIFGFMAITGLSPSMVRAGMVAGLSLLAWYYGRKFHPLVLLPFVAAVTVAIDPSYAWGDLGWLLSFAAFAGVMILAPLLQCYFFGEKEPGTIRQIIGETISAQLVTLPILLLAFGLLSNVALLANILVLPLVPAAMLLTFVAGIGAWFLPAYAPMLGFPAASLLKYMVGVIHEVANLPGAVSAVPINMLAVIGMYGAMGVACIYMWRKTGLNLRETNLVK